MRLRHNIIFFFCVLSLLSYKAGAQTKYWVFFTDKDTTGFDPYHFFDEKAIARRELQNLPLFDYSDVPVKEDYVQEIGHIADSIGNISRWFNGMGVWASASGIEKIRSLPFVKEVRPMEFIPLPTSKPENKDTLADDKSYLYYQLHRLQGEKFAAKHINGAGVRIAVLDVGFTGLNQHKAFRQLFINGQVKKTFDFVRKKENVYAYGSHGTMVMSCIAGRYDNENMGLAPEAEFLLARTERDITEWKEEEDNWVAAMEWADQNGAQIISSSLGYTSKRYFVRDMNGGESLIAKGATMAARKGILVLTAAGNDGDNSWKYICTPADADSILTVGGTDPVKNYHISFSSFGPTSDGRLKPNVCAPAAAWVATPENYNEEEGTSFSTPLVAGFAACVWQMHPKLSCMQILKEIEKSGSLYPYYDYAHGYGIPQAGYFLDEKEKAAPTFLVSEKDDSIEVEVSDTAFSDSQNADSMKLLYYHIADSTGFLTKYAVVKVKNKKALVLDRNDIPENGSLQVHYEGYTEERKLQ